MLAKNLILLKLFKPTQLNFFYKTNLVRYFPKVVTKPSVKALIETFGFVYDALG